MNIIHAYTREQGIADGILLPLEEHFAHSDFPRLLLEGLRLLKKHRGKFELGQLIITANAARTVETVDVLVSLIRHSFGDWGDLCEVDREGNEHGLKDDRRLFSSYKLQDEQKLWIITEWNREATTALLPEDY